MSLWTKLEPGAVGLAPMAGITDSPFRQLCRDCGADFVMSEMISAAGVCHNQNQEIWDLQTESWITGSKSLEYARLKDSERPIILQIFGNEPKKMAVAAKIIAAKFAPDGIDINMGCPMRKVMKNGSGVALMDNHKLAADITSAVKSALGNIPLSVKTRLGVRQPNILELAPRLEQAGADVVIIHGRLQTELFSGPVDLATIGKVAANLSIPVIANGGIIDRETHEQAIAQTGCLATVIGQAARGNPFVFKQIKDPDYQPGWPEKIETMRRHAKLQVEYRQDEKFGLQEMRKHLAWYIKGIKNAAAWRAELVRVEALAELEDILNRLEAKVPTSG